MQLAVTSQQDFAAGMESEVTKQVEFEKSGYIDATNISEETLRELLKSNKPLKFDWENKWLRGDQYAHMLNNIDVYG